MRFTNKEGGRGGCKSIEVAVLHVLNARALHNTVQLVRQLLQPCWEGLVLGDRARWSGGRLAAAFPSAGSSPRNVALLLVRRPVA